MMIIMLRHITTLMIQAVKMTHIVLYRNNQIYAQEWQKNLDWITLHRFRL